MNSNLIAAYVYRNFCHAFGADSIPKPAKAVRERRKRTNKNATKSRQNNQKKGH